MLYFMLNLLQISDIINDLMLFRGHAFWNYNPSMSSRDFIFLF